MGKVRDAEVAEVKAYSQAELEKIENTIGNAVAPAGYVWMCGACGKRSKDKYGDQAISYGWDESCMMNCWLEKEGSNGLEHGV